MGDRGVLFQIASVVVICASIITGVLVIQDSLHHLDTRLIKIEANTNDRWRAQDMQLWAERLKSANVNLTIPDPEKVIHIRR